MEKESWSPSNLRIGPRATGLDRDECRPPFTEVLSFREWTR